MDHERERKIEAVEQLISDAKESKHRSDLAFVRKKWTVQAKVASLLEQSDIKDMPEVVRKAFWLVSEFVFNETVWILVDDKK